MITVNANAPALKPKSDPADMQKIQDLYRYLDEKLAGLEERMKELGCDKLVIIVTTDDAGKEQK